jgi:hypothetical protein
MAISDSQKIDLLWKKVGFGKTKTDTNANKKAPNEPNASSFIIKDADIWNQSSSITSTIPSANSSIANVYIDSVSGALETTEDGASSDNRTWKTSTTNWIPPSFGATYQLKVYAAPTSTADVQTNGTQLFETGSGSNDEWYFDYQSGILNFIGSNLPSAIGTSSGNVIYVAGAVYIGNTGTASPTGTNMVYHTFANLTALFAATSVETGDFVKVTDGGDGEYRLYIANQADPANAGHLTLIGTADSAVTDAGTLTTTITHTSGASTVIGNISSGKKVTSVTVNVTVAFDGSAPTLTVGDASDTNRLQESDDNDLKDAYAYESTPNHVYSSATDESILVYFDADSSTTGTAVVTVTYA